LVFLDLQTFFLFQDYYFLFLCLRLDEVFIPLNGAELLEKT